MATVYIPTLTAGPKLEACLSSLERQTIPVQIVVADNGEGDGCAEMIRDKFERVRRVAIGRNLGFGPALNRAIEASGSGPIILLNDDAVAEPSFVEELVSVWNRGEVTMVAGVMLSGARPDRIDSAGIVADTALNAHDHLTGQPVSTLAHARDPFGPTGGGALYDRDAFNAVGGFDSRIFLYYEDLDLALRMRLNGGSCRLSRDARATHGYSETLGAGNPDKYGFTGWSRGYLLRKYGILKRPTLAAKVLLIESVVCSAQIVRDRTFAGLRGRIDGWRDAADADRMTPPVDALNSTSVAGSLSKKFARRVA